MVPEQYVFVFKDSKQAEYWRRLTQIHFEDEVISSRDVSDGGYVSFSDSIYYFVSECVFKRNWMLGRRSTVVYPQEAIYIILNDYERTKLDTYSDYLLGKCKEEPTVRKNL